VNLVFTFFKDYKIKDITIYESFMKFLSSQGINEDFLKEFDNKVKENI